MVQWRGYDVLRRKRGLVANDVDSGELLIKLVEKADGRNAESSGRAE